MCSGIDQNISISFNIQDQQYAAYTSINESETYTSIQVSVNLPPHTEYNASLTVDYDVDNGQSFQANFEISKTSNLVALYKLSSI